MGSHAGAAVLDHGDDAAQMAFRPFQPLDDVAMTLMLMTVFVLTHRKSHSAILTAAPGGDKTTRPTAICGDSPFPLAREAHMLSGTTSLVEFVKAGGRAES